MIQELILPHSSSWLLKLELGCFQEPKRSGFGTPFDITLEHRSDQMRHFRIFRVLLGLLLGTAGISGCSKDSSVGCFYVEIAPGRFVPVKFNRKYRTDMSIRYGDQTVVFELPWGLNSASSLMEFDGKLHILALDARIREDRSKWNYRGYRQEGERFKEIPISEFPRSIAILNIWRPGDPRRYRTGISGNQIDAVRLSRELNPEDIYLSGSEQAWLWYMLEVSNRMDRALGAFTLEESKEFLSNYISNHKPLRLTSIELRPVPEEQCEF